MDYKKLKYKFKNKKLQFDLNKVWFPRDKTKNGFNIGDIVWHVNKDKQYLTKFKIVVENFYTEYIIKDGFREYCKTIEVVVLKPIEGTWTSGDEYAAVWFNRAIEFPFNLSQILQSLSNEVTHCIFKRADDLWSKFNIRDLS
ncbi:MAG: hypothetical protein PF487_09045 [Bacteroidales bacterium]|jgi:hypothetical protein|nr:hypothetical protein [Bacteroidales bacterium]